jgi:AhpC/TSA family
MKALLVTLMIMVATTAALAAPPQSPLAPPKMPTAAKTDTGLKVGDKAPDFALPNGDGKLVMLSEYTARTPVVLVFYRGFW